MKITSTLSFYLAKTYAYNLLALLLGLFAVVFLFDTIELIRRAAKFDDVPLVLVLQMGLLKLPEVIQILLPFAILFSAIFTFWSLTRKYELIVVRAAGFSVWQFLAPVLIVAVFAGLLQMSVVNPIGSLLLQKFEQLERVHLKRQKNEIALFKEGLWLRQSLQDSGGYVILHAQRVTQPGWVLKDVKVLFFSEQDTFQGRLNASEALLKPQQWHFKDVRFFDRNKPPVEQETYFLPTVLTIEDVEESFVSPEALSFWDMPEHIQILEETGFDTSKLKVYYQNLLSQPLMFAAMILLGAAVSMRPPRSQGAIILVAGGIFIGFVIFFVSSFLQALGATQQIPVIMAAWSPAIVSFLFGLSAMINLEDG